MQSRRYLISGNVQGVFYRANVQKNANSEGMSGYVRNLPDGRVEAAVTCKAPSCFNAFEAILKKGSPKSQVASVSFETIDTIYSNGFVIR